MNISEIEIQNIRPCMGKTKIVGNVTFHISGGVGDRSDVVNFECRCDMPEDEILSHPTMVLRNSLKAEAIRQANRMPEIRSGEEVLVFLSPNQ